MRRLQYFFSAILASIVFTAFSQPLVTDNPLLIHSNQPIAWDKVNADVIRAAVDQVVQISDKRVANIIAAVKPGTGPGSTLVALDLLFYDLYDLDMKMQLISNSSPSDSTRNAAERGDQVLTDYQTALSLNQALPVPAGAPITTKCDVMGVCCRSAGRSLPGDATPSRAACNSACGAPWTPPPRWWDSSAGNRPSTTRRTCKARMCSA